MSRKVLILMLGLVAAVVFGVAGYRAGLSGHAREALSVARTVIILGLLVYAMGLFLQRRKAR